MHHLILIISVFMLATAPVIVKFLTLPPLTILVWRLTFVSLLLFPFAYKSIGELNKKKLLNILIASFVLAVHFWIWFAGIPMLNVSIVAVLFATNPIYTAVFGYFILREPFKKRYFIALFLSIIGVVITFSSSVKGSLYDDNSEVLGMVYIIIAAILYSLYMVMSKKMRQGLSNTIFNFSLNFGALIFGVTFLMFEHFIQRKELVAPSMIDFSSWKYLFLLALMPSVLGHNLMIYSLPKFNLNYVSCMKMMSPLSASLMGVYFFNDKLSYELIIGFVLVSAGVTFAIPWKRSKGKTP